MKKRARPVKPASPLALTGELLDSDFDDVGTESFSAPGVDFEENAFPDRSDEKGRPARASATSRRRPRTTPTNDDGDGPRFLPDSEPPGWAEP